uniref:Uncharacterized protein n=2 Tax=Triticum urartu TaxID=4572 RepID=A0A8R7U6Q8_TRIUA
MEALGRGGKVCLLQIDGGTGTGRQGPRRRVTRAGCGCLHIYVFPSVNNGWMKLWSTINFQGRSRSRDRQGVMVARAVIECWGGCRCHCRVLGRLLNKFIYLSCELFHTSDHHIV